jgi:GTP-binding protein HflX
MEELAERLAVELPRPTQEIDVLVPYARGELVARVHREGEVLAERHTADGTQLHARVNGDLAGALGQFASNGAPA